MIPAGTLATLRADFGGTIADFTVASTGGSLRFATATLTLWDSISGGTRYTDLELGGLATDHIDVGVDGRIPVFQGPPGVTHMWIDGGGDRVLIISADFAADFAAAAGSYAAQAQAAAASVLGLGTTTDSLVAAALANVASASRAAGNGVWAQLPAAADKVVFVTPRGNDSNDGKTPKTAFATVGAAQTALGGPGLIQLGFGALVDGSQWNFDSTNGVTIRGVAAPTAGATPSSSVTFTGTGSGSFISARSSTGFKLKDVMVLYSSSSFTGRLVDLRDAGSANTVFTALEDVFLGGASAIRTADCLVDISNTHSLRFERCQFRGGANFGIRGKNVSTDTCNAISLQTCYFNDNTTAHIVNPGDGWVVSACTWEPLHSGAAGAMQCQSGFTFNGLTIIGGWAGDVVSGAGGIQFDLAGQAVNILGTMIGGNTGSTGIRFANIGASSPKGLNVAARFDGPTTGIDQTGVAPEGYDYSCSAFSTNVTTPIAGATTFRAAFETRDDLPIIGLRSRSTASGRVAIRFQSDKTNTYFYDLGMDLDGGNLKRFGLRDMSRSGTPHVWYITALGSIILGSGTADLATTATDGFVYIPTVNGTPTGTPTAVPGMVPLAFDRSTGKFCAYFGGAWKSTTLT